MKILKLPIYGQDRVPPRHTWKLVDMCDDSYDAVEEYYFNKSVAGISGRENWNKQLATQVYSRSLQPEIFTNPKTSFM